MQNVIWEVKKKYLYLSVVLDLDHRSVFFFNILHTNC